MITETKIGEIVTRDMTSGVSISRRGDEIVFQQFVGSSRVELELDAESVGMLAVVFQKAIDLLAGRDLPPDRVVRGVKFGNYPSLLLPTVRLGVKQHVGTLATDDRKKSITVNIRGNVVVFLHVMNHQKKFEIELGAPHAEKIANWFAAGAAMLTHGGGSALAS